MKVTKILFALALLAGVEGVGSGHGDIQQDICKWRSAISNEDGKLSKAFDGDTRSTYLTDDFYGLIGKINDMLGVPSNNFFESTKNGNVPTTSPEQSKEFKSNLDRSYEILKKALKEKNPTLTDEFFCTNIAPEWEKFHNEQIKEIFKLQKKMLDTLEKIVKKIAIAPYLKHVLKHIVNPALSKINKKQAINNPAP